MQSPGLGVALAGLAVFLIAGYWNYFRGAFVPRPEVGCC